MFSVFQVSEIYYCFPFTSYANSVFILFPSLAFKSSKTCSIFLYQDRKINCSVSHPHRICIFTINHILTNMNDFHQRFRICNEISKLVMLNEEMRVTQNFRAVGLVRICAQHEEKDWIFRNTPWIIVKYSSISLFMTEKHSSDCLPPPIIPKNNLNQYHHPSSCCQHLCSLPPRSRLCSRPWWIFVRWTPVTSTSVGCKVESNNKCYKTENMLCYLVQ